MKTVVRVAVMACMVGGVATGVFGQESGAPSKGAGKAAEPAKGEATVAEPVKAAGDGAGKGESRLVVQEKGCEAGVWTMDLDAAKAYAKKNGLVVLLNFTGSDWCPYCVKVEKDVFATAAWQAYAKANLALVTLDFPRDTSKVPESYRKRNEALQAEHEVEGFPTFVLLDPEDGSVLGKFGSPKDQGPNAFMRQLWPIMRGRATELARITESLGAERGARYRALVGEQKSVMKDFEKWLAGRPERNDENTKAFEGFRDKVEKIVVELDTMDLEYSLKRLGGDAQAGSAALAAMGSVKKAREVVDEVEKAETDLRDWLLGMPASGAESAGILKAKTGALQQQLEALRKASTVAGVDAK